MGVEENESPQLLSTPFRLVNPLILIRCHEFHVVIHTIWNITIIFLHTDNCLAVGSNGNWNKWKSFAIEHPFLTGEERSIGQRAQPSYEVIGFVPGLNPLNVYSILYIHFFQKPGVMIPIPQYPLYSATLAEYCMEQVGQIKQAFSFLNCTH